jgi:hypothetical protein
VPDPAGEPVLDREAITQALRRLGERLAYRGVVADLYVFGGAAMALAYDLRRSTRDIDAPFHPHGAVIAEAQAVALELSLPPWWLNKQASAYRTRRRPGGAPCLRSSGAPRPRRLRPAPAGDEAARGPAP